MNGGGRADCQTDAAINDDLAPPSEKLELFRGFKLEGGRNWILINNYTPIEYFK